MLFYWFQSLYAGKSAENLNLNFICLPNHFFPIFCVLLTFRAFSILSEKWAIRSKQVRKVRWRKRYCCWLEMKKDEAKVESTKKIQLQSQWQWGNMKNFLIFCLNWMNKRRRMRNESFSRHKMRRWWQQKKIYSRHEFRLRIFTFFSFIIIA